jgi:hypothetical protein
MKLYIINVGVNSGDAQKYQLRSPIFVDGRFEVIPIMESKARARFSNIHYEAIKCFNNKSNTLKNYVPEDFWNYSAHYDPEFLTYTYGDNWIKPKGANFLKVEKEDILLFLSRLYNFANGDFSGNGDQYFIGYFIVQDIVIKSNITNEIHDDRLKNNPHYMRYKNGMNETFIILIGDPKKSARFTKAIKVEPAICELIFNGQYVPDHDFFICNETGDILLNKNGKPKSMKNFHSITRPVQSFLDDNILSHKKSLEKLMCIFREYI